MPQPDHDKRRAAEHEEAQRVAREIKRLEAVKLKVAEWEREFADYVRRLRMAAALQAVGVPGMVVGEKLSHPFDAPKGVTISFSRTAAERVAARLVQQEEMEKGMEKGNEERNEKEKGA